MNAAFLVINKENSLKIEPGMSVTRSKIAGYFPLTLPCRLKSSLSLMSYFPGTCCRHFLAKAVS